MPFKYFGKVNFTPYTKVEHFADELQAGRIMGTRCRKCKTTSIPPRAYCLKCMSEDFDWVPISGKGKLMTFTVIHSAPTGFGDMAPYAIGIIELDEGGRLMAWIGGVEFSALKVGMRMRVVPKMFEDIPEIKLYYQIEPDKKGKK